MNLGDWLTEPEAAKRLGISWRTLLRRVAKGEGPERQMRPRKGAKPEPVYNPRDVERMSAQRAVVVRPEMLPRPERPMGQEIAVAPIFMAVLDRLAGALEKFAPPPAKPEVKAWMTPGEASAYLGLSEGLIRRLIRDGKLPRFREARGYVVAKVHLDNIDSMAGLTGLQQTTAALRETVQARRAAR